MKIIQISDTHLFANDESEIFGIKCNIKFNEVINKIIDDEIHDADMIFLTGDISQDESAQSYKKIARHLSNLKLPVYWIPGNHDNLLQLEAVFMKMKNFHRVSSLSSAHWHFIFLNSKIDGREDGELSVLELEMLKDKIHSAPIHKKIAIVMHHHPAAVGTPLIDNYILQNNQEFWDVVAGTSVRLIICGHVHGDYQIEYNNIMIETAPATCLQWVKGTKKIKIDARIGYKIYYFEENNYKAVGKLG